MWVFFGQKIVMNIISIYKRNRKASHTRAQRLVYNILEWKPNGEYK